MFLVDVARFKESILPLNLFDVGKKVCLDFICITAERVSYADPGALHVYDVFYISWECHLDHYQMQRAKHRISFFSPEEMHAR